MPKRTEGLPRVPFFIHDDINFHYLEAGEGTPFFFQHGLGGDAAAVWALVGSLPGFRLISLDFRAHGKTNPVGKVEKICFNSFADDLVALMDHTGISKAIIGGSSMGAGVGLNCALRHSDRVAALVLQRPAWLDSPRPQNVEIFQKIAELLKTKGPQSGLEAFRHSPLFESVAAISPDSANSLLVQFSLPRAVERVSRLERIPIDAPNWDRGEWRDISVPTLVLANRNDPIHPFEYGIALAQEIPRAKFKELTDKSIDLGKYTREVRSFIAEFLRSVGAGTPAGANQ